MQYKIKLTDVPFFADIAPSYAKDLVNTFSIVRVRKDDMILNLEDPVPGFFLIAEGSVNVFAADFEVLITTLDTGSTFGEMSLLENENSSASLQAAEDSVLLLCDRKSFQKVLSENFVFSAAFYKGASKVLSSRLRSTNTMVETEMNRGRRVIRNMMDDHGVIAKLGFTQGSLNNTGESMVSKLADLLPVIDKLGSDVPSTGGEIDEIKKTIRHVLTIDSQNFDIISQQMDQINQHLVNIQRLMQGMDMHDIKGDSNIFNIEKDKSDEDEITFF
ncbi:MAG: cyclic nucleotide-binding domain-containing protein [Leptospirales bacterium]